MNGRETVERENLKIRSMVMMTLHYTRGEREERSWLEAKLAMAKKWAMIAQESLSKLEESLDLVQAENEMLKGLKEFDT